MMSAPGVPGRQGLVALAGINAALQVGAQGEQFFGGLEQQFVVPRVRVGPLRGLGFGLLAGAPANVGDQRDRVDPGAPGRRGPAARGQRRARGRRGR